MLHVKCSMNILIFGPQGSGKGTQSELLAKKLNLAHIEMGQLLRTATKKKTDLGGKLNDIINVKKELVSDEVIFEVLAEEIGYIPDDKGIILDGVPRRKTQIELIEKLLEKSCRSVDVCIYLDITEQESLRRIANRYACVDCGHKIVLGKDAISDKDDCPYCGGDIQQRADDTLEGIKKRLEIFYRDTRPVAEYYQEMGKLIDIRGEKAVEEVFQDILNALKERNLWKGTDL